MKKIKLLLLCSLLFLSGCEGENTKHHHHKTDYTLTLFSVFGDTVNTWNCRINEVQYQGNQILFIDSLGNPTKLFVFSGAVTVEKK